LIVLERAELRGESQSKRRAEKTPMKMRINRGQNRHGVTV
jgi:hypothetical protein